MLAGHPACFLRPPLYRADGKPEPNRSNDDGGQTALHFAAQLGKIQVVEALLNAGADKAVKATSGRWQGKTALDEAQRNNHPAIVKLLRD